ncbi:MAG: DUF2892 domain-containing protein [Bacteroidetes bacterium]|nr:MAG: DUF2892 domain-containing protein [Bacteroidota bacterium]
MQKNMGLTDKIIRIGLAAVVAFLFFTKTISGTWPIVLLAAAAIFLLTSAVSFCPLYKLLGINSCPIKKK